MIANFRVRACPAALGILLITAIALAVNGYHLGIDDAEIYVPGIKMAADHSLFPAGSAFFDHHANLTLFPNLIGLSARLFHLPIDWAIFLWYIVSLFLLFWAAWQLLRACFESKTAAWGGLCVLAVALAAPVAGTALILVDPYLTSRSLSTPATLFAIAAFAQNRFRAAFLWVLAVAAIHPQMSAYAMVALACFAIARQLHTRPLLNLAPRPVVAALMALPLSFELSPAHGIYKEILQSRAYFLVSSWQWYEWVGVVAPLVLLGWFSRMRSLKVRPSFQLLSAALIPFGIFFTLIGILFASAPQFETIARLQPMRCFHLIYLVMFLFAGALIGEYVLRDSVWRWCALFVPVFAVMWTLQAQEFPSSPHIEMPGLSYTSGWVPALLWVRDHTPKGALFALDPDYLTSPGVDLHGFRAIAERSALADELKDSGAVSLFPELGNQWKREVTAQKAWRASHYRNYATLVTRYGVQWFIVPKPDVVPGLICPYQNHDVRIYTTGCCSY
jgi:hypothetical protein